MKRGKSLKKLKTLEEKKMEEILVYFSLKYQGDFMKILEALQKKRNSNERREKKGIREC